MRLQQRQGSCQVGGHKAQAHAAGVHPHHRDQVCRHPGSCGESCPALPCGPDLRLCPTRNVSSPVLLLSSWALVVVAAVSAWEL